MFLLVAIEIFRISSTYKCPRDQWLEDLDKYLRPDLSNEPITCIQLIMDKKKSIINIQDLGLSAASRHSISGQLIIQVIYRKSFFYF
jgi:hypothetical protein